MSNCSIVIPVWNRLTDTETCIDSIRRNTKYPYKLIVIDNASDTETKTYLERLRVEMPDRVKLIRNKKNEGFIKAVNKGIREAESEFVCILNNDTVVAPGWLEELVTILCKDPKIAIVNPSSNTLGQGLPDGVTIDQVSEKLKHERGLFVELGNAFGFCMLTRKKLFDEIGMFDECYGMGYFEDTDFSLRAKEKGYKTVRALASFVLHKEKKSFSILPSFKNGFKRNKKLFETKWGKTKRVMVIFKTMNTNSKKNLNEILEKYTKERAWIYVVSPYFETLEFFKKFSNLTFYHCSKALYVYAFFKILFKKKKSDIILADNDLFLRILGIIGIFHSSELKKIGGIK